MSELRQRAKPADEAVPAPNPAAGAEAATTATTTTATAPPTTTDVSQSTEHPSGKQGHGRVIQLLRGISFIIFFIAATTTIQLSQLIGTPLYWLNRPLFYDFVALTKQFFGIVITTMTYWWGPTTIRISGDASVAGQIKTTKDGRVEFNFPERMVMIANHQIYTDWLYLWWVGYANKPHTHGHIYIILKESLKYIPIIGPGMMYYGFIFMSRKMAVDQPRMAHRLQKLNQAHTDPDGKTYYNPMWLLLFPEGTNASHNGRQKSAAWAKKMGYKDPEHMMLPRSTGMYFCLSELKGSVEYVYDCTVAYEGIPRGGYGEDYFTLSGTYFAGKPPKSVNLHWRRFKVADIPLESVEVFDQWLRERWYEKDAMMEQYLLTGRLPPSPSAAADDDDNDDQPEYIETEVRTHYPWEILRVFSVISTAFVVYRLGLRLYLQFR